MEYQLNKWKRQDWRKDTRHYSCQMRQNLFGQWVVLRRWGRVSAMQKQCIEEACDRYEEGVEILRQLNRARFSRSWLDFIGNKFSSI